MGKGKIETRENHIEKDRNDGITAELDGLVRMIDGKMEGGIGRLSVAFSEKQPEGTVKEKVHYGRRDAWNPWNWGEMTRF